MSWILPLIRKIDHILGLIKKFNVKINIWLSHIKFLYEMIYLDTAPKRITWFSYNVLLVEFILRIIAMHGNSSCWVKWTTPCGLGIVLFNGRKSLYSNFMKFSLHHSIYFFIFSYSFCPFFFFFQSNQGAASHLWGFCTNITSVLR